MTKFPAEVAAVTQRDIDAPQAVEPAPLQVEPPRDVGVEAPSEPQGGADESELQEFVEEDEGNEYEESEGVIEHVLVLLNSSPATVL